LTKSGGHETARQQATEGKGKGGIMASYALAGLMNDKDLVQRWRRGEEEAAFSQLYSRYRKRVFSTAYRIMRDPEDARDATQEIFLKVHRSLSCWDPDKSSLSTWLFRLAANHSIDCWRSRRRRLSTETAGEPADAAIHGRRGACSNMRNPLGLLEAKEAAGMVEQCVDGLPELQRRFIILRYFRELSLEEIAALEGRSIGTVKGLLHRATRSVRRRLQNHRPS
jgi:RNA polymerase sigma-70 factor (ECF subfamily)